MQKTLRMMVAFAAGAGAMLAMKTASAAVNGVLFVHGTSDYPAASGTSAYNNTSSATGGYWTQDTIDKIRGGRRYLVAGYQGASCNAIGSSRSSGSSENYNCSSWASIASQAASWINANGITDLVIVTHSNGSGPVRYMLAHPTADSNVSNLMGKTRRMVWMAGDNAGTQLADSVTNGGSVANVLNAIASFLSITNYNTPATWAQRRDRMSTYNSTSNGAFNTTSYPCASGSTCGGKSSQYVQGTRVYANLFSGDAWCGGYPTTGALYAAAAYEWGTSACQDGFIPCDSSAYNGSQLVSNARLNHNQSRRDCQGAPSAVLGSINGVIGYSAPADYTISPAQQACNTSTQGWVLDYVPDGHGGYTGSSGNAWFNGCPTSWRTDSYADYDCQSAYGSETHGSTTINLPDNYSTSGYAGISCPDSWLGDGVCDVCLIAKYGFDVATGSTGTDDCANFGSGTSTLCSDLGNLTGSYTPDGSYVYKAAH